MVTEFDFLAGYMGVYLAQSLFLPVPVLTSISVGRINDAGFRSLKVFCTFGSRFQNGLERFHKPLTSR